MKHLLTISIIFSFTSLFGQHEIPPGKFVNGDNYLIIDNENYLSFCLKDKECPNIWFIGEGHFHYVDQQLNIETISSSMQEASPYSIVDNIDVHSLRINILSDSIPVAQHNAIIKDKHNRIIAGAVTSVSGEAYLDLSSFFDTDSPGFYDLNEGILSLNSICYQNLNIPLDSVVGKDIMVHLPSKFELSDMEINFIIVNDDGTPDLYGPIFKETHVPLIRSKTTSVGFNSQNIPGPIIFTRK